MSGSNPRTIRGGYGELLVSSLPQSKQAEPELDDFDPQLFVKGGQGNRWPSLSHVRKRRVAAVSARQGARNIPRRGYRSAPRCGKDRAKSVRRTLVDGATVGHAGGRTELYGMTALAAWLTGKIEVPGYPNYPQWRSCGDRHIPSRGNVRGIRHPAESHPYDHQWGMSAECGNGLWEGGVHGKNTPPRS